MSFTRGLITCLLFAASSLAVQVYLNPPPTLPSRLSPEHAALAISHHLGLEFFEPAGSYGGFYSNERSFVGEGIRSGLLLTISEVDAKDVLPESMQSVFSLPDGPTISSLSSVVSTYLHRAPHVFTAIFTQRSLPRTAVPRFLDLFSVSSAATETFIAELSTLSAFIDEPTTSKFAAIEIKGLSALAETYGRSSEHYNLAAQAIRAFLSSVLANGDQIKLALLTYPSPALNKRQDSQPPQSPLPVPSPNPQEPIGSISTCFPTADVCTNSTDTCSGRGQCVQASKAGRTCFVCSCRTVVNKEGKSETWVGEKCERKDISGPFVLITGTVIALILLIGGSISLLYTIGDLPLPSTLLAGVAGGVRKE